MADYSAYPYGRMLSYIERRCTELGDDKKYIEYILSMENAESIERLIKMYGSCYKVLAYLFFGTKKLPYAWYNTETWGYNNGWLIDELNYCLNENILKWYKRQEDVTDEQALKCIVNLRNAKNTDAVQSCILVNSTPQVDNGIRHFTHVRNNFYKLRNKMFKGISASWEKGYYISYLRYLAFHGHILDVSEMAFCRDGRIKYDNLIEEYKIEVVEAKKRAEERRKKIKEEQRRHELSIGSNVLDSVFSTAGDMALSFLFSLPFAFFGGIIGNMGRRR